MFYINKLYKLLDFNCYCIINIGLKYLSMIYKYCKESDRILLNYWYYIIYYF